MKTITGIVLLALCAPIAPVLGEDGPIGVDGVMSMCETTSDMARTNVRVTRAGVPFDRLEKAITDNVLDPEISGYLIAGQRIVHDLAKDRSMSEEEIVSLHYKACVTGMMKGITSR